MSFMAAAAAAMTGSMTALGRIVTTMPSTCAVLRGVHIRYKRWNPHNVRGGMLKRSGRGNRILSQATWRKPKDDDRRTHKKQVYGRVVSDLQDVAPENMTIPRFHIEPKWVKGIHEEVMEGVPDAIRRIFCVENATVREWRKAHYPIFAKEYGGCPSNMAAPEVQVAIATSKIEALQQQIKESNDQNKAAKYFLRRLIMSRKWMLLYLKRKNLERYMLIIKKLRIEHPVQTALELYRGKYFMRKARR